ncbi:MAG: 23S rRNA (guanosine(2251)-2'-O)-methyltransferase RlmB [Flavobacteriales bacterium]
MADKKERPIYGKHPVLEAIDSGTSIDRILVKKNGGRAVEEVLEAARSRSIPYQKVPPVKLDKLVKGKHQGVIALISPIRFADTEEVLASAFEKGTDPLFLLLDGITDVRNFGAICRTAECCGVDAVFVPARGGARINNDAVHTSAGALTRIPVARPFDLQAMPARFREHGIGTAACTEKGASPVSKEELSGPLAVVMGDEGEGVSERMLRQVDQKLRLPLYGSIASLNVSVAAGMVLYEVIRQRALAS